MKMVSVIVPVYFNAESLPRLFEALQAVEAALAGLGCALELIFVDDGSGDDSLAVLLAFRERRPGTKVVKLSRNFGAVAASKAGLKYVTGDCFLWLAADLQDPPHLIVSMAQHWLDGAKYVIAERTTRRDPLMTRLFASVYYALVRRLILRDYPRGGFDLMLLDTSLIAYIRESGRRTNLSLLAHGLGIQPVTLPYEREKRKHGTSRWTFTRKLAYFTDSILGFSVLPLRLTMLVGLVAALAGFCGGIYALLSNPAASGVAALAALAALVSFLLGVLIVMLGIVGEYVWRIFDAVMQRPEVVVDQVFE